VPRVNGSGNLGLPEGTPAAILTELHTLDGRLDLALDRLAEALDAGSVDFLPGELARLPAGLDAARDRLDAVCEKPAGGVDPEGRPAGEGDC
jgi:hypothetical protein